MNYTFTTADAGTHIFAGGLVPVKMANGRSVTATGVSGPAVTAGTQGGINVNPNVTVGLQVLAFGESNAGGTTTGKTGTPNNGTPFTAGAPFAVTVNAVDQYWNVTTSSSPSTVNVVTTDPYAPVPGNEPLSSGTTVFSPILVTAGVQTLTASGAGTPNTSSNLTIKAGIANRMLIVLPGETQAQGSYQSVPAGKSGTPSNLLAGQTLLATVYGVDSYYNTDTSDNTDKIWAFLPSDAYAVKPASQTLTSGVTTFTLIPVTATSQVVKSTSAMANPTYQTNAFTVSPDTATGNTQRIQLVLPGETAVAGLPPYNIQNGGKTGLPSADYAGTLSTVTVRLVDRFYNLIQSGKPMPTVTIHLGDTSLLNSSDAQVSLTNGVAVDTFTFYTQSNQYATGSQQGWTLTGTDAGVTHYITDASTNVIVWPGPVTRLRLLTANQTSLEGSDPAGAGKTNPNTPGSATAGTAFPVNIQATDNYWNQNYGLGPQYIGDIGDQVYLQTNDAYIQSDATTTMVNGQAAFNSFTPRTAQTNWTFSSVDVTSATISSQTVSGVNVSAASGGFLHYQILLPGELPAPGSGQYPTAGKTGTPAAQIAGQAISAVTVNLVDDFWNPIQSGPALPWVNLTAPQSVDTYAILPSSAQMTNPGGSGYSAVFASTVTILTSSAALSHQLQAGSGGVYAAVTSAFFTVTPNSLATLQLLVPGETSAPGKPVNWSFNGDPAGKIGIPSAPGAFVAGTAYTATVNATDSYFNVISTNSLVFLASDDPYGTPSNTSSLSKTLTNGSTTFAFTLLSAQNQNAVAITHQLSSTWTLTGYTSPAFTMKAFTPPSKLQIILPGQTAVPGNVSSLGVSGSITPAVAGEPYIITVRLTDAWYNAVGNTLGNTTIHLVTTDPFAPSDGDQLINSGAINYTATYGSYYFQTANNPGWTVTATTSAGTAYTGTTVGPVVVGPDTNTGSYHTHQLLALLPGETYTPGKITGTGGRTGTPFVGGSLTTPIAGQNIPVTVLATDRFYNLIVDTQNPAAVISASPTLYPAYQVPAPNFTVNNGSFTVVGDLQASTTTANFYVNQTAVQTYTYSAATTTVFAVNQGPATQLQLLIVGESAIPGKLTAPAGKTGTPNNGSSFTAGQFYQATVNAMDNYFNLVPSAGAKIQMSVDDPYATQNYIQQNLSGGTTTFLFQFLTANGTGWHITVSTVSGSVLTSTTSVALPVVASTPTQIVATVPGLTLVPGDVTATVSQALLIH